MQSVFQKLILCALLAAAMPAAAGEAAAELRDCPTCPEMVVIPAGSFDMGSYDGDVDEAPVHHVIIAKPFAMSKTEITQIQWRAVMQGQSRTLAGNDPSYFSSCGEDCPVEQVSWNDVQIFLQRLSARTRKQYRLPTEAEWEYACRAGKQEQYCGGNDAVKLAWYGGATDSQHGSQSTAPVAGKEPNAFGLYDMSGNVWEWVADSYHDNYKGAPGDGRAWQSDGKLRVLRGGSWFNDLPALRATSRHKEAPVFRSKFAGFRVVQVLP